MLRLAIFVDGSNLFGSLKRLNLHIQNYEDFFGFILNDALKVWDKSAISGPTNLRLTRVLWYEVGSIDQWDLSDAEIQERLRDWLMRDKGLKTKYFALATEFINEKQDTRNHSDIAWEIFLEEISTWYEQKRASVERQRDFHFGVMSSTSFIDIIACGHLKVDILNQIITEKGLDTSLAVDMVTMADTYDIALVVTGDADSIPSVEHIKRQGKHVGVIEFIKGFPPEKKGRQSSSKLKAKADFVVQIYETDLIQNKVGTVADRENKRSR